MAITKKQIEKRKDYPSGSSDAAAIMGLDPFRTPYDVYAEKTGKLPKQKETAVMQRGKFLEPGILMFAESILGRILKRDLERFSKDGLFIDHPDGIVQKTDEPVEAKAQSYGAKEFWGDEGTDIMPDRVVVQCEIHIHCGEDESDICHVPIDLPYRGLQMFMVKRDDDLINRIVDAVGEFNEKYIKTDTPPPSLPSPETVKRLIRVPKSVITIPNGLQLVEAREAAAAIKKDADNGFDAADLALKAALKTAEQGNFDGGYVSYFQYHKNPETKIREGYDFRRIYVKYEKGK